MTDCNCHGAGGKLAQSRVGALERPRYAPGLILEDSDLTAAVDYTRELNRLLFRSLFGCGVVCGLTIDVEEACGLKVTVAPGLALDGCGDPLHLREPVQFTLEEREGVPRRGAPTARDFWVIACAGEKSCRPRSVVCDEDDLQELQQATRTRATVEVSITATVPGCVCGCASYDPAKAIEGVPAAERAGKLDELAQRLLPASGTEIEPYDCCADPHGCHGPHRTDPGCAADCGCGDPCGCGCCVLLAWIHWFPMDESNNGGSGWAVLHNGVRRFLRPGLLPDPMAGLDQRPGNWVKTREDGTKAAQVTNQVREQELAIATNAAPPPERAKASLADRAKLVAEARMAAGETRAAMLERAVRQLDAAQPKPAETATDTTPDDDNAQANAATAAGASGEKPVRVRKDKLQKPDQG